MSVRIFISCVSSEFRAYRDQLRHDLTRHNVDVKVQEDFKDYGVVTLDKLDIYIRACDAVVHLVGDMTGAAAKPASTQAIRAKYPDIAERLPALGESLERGEEISYTQWEAWLALYHGKPLLIAEAAGDAEQRGREPDLALAAASRAAQQAHLARLRAAGRHPECTFATLDQLAKYALSSAILDLLVRERGATPLRDTGRFSTIGLVIGMLVLLSRHGLPAGHFGVPAPETRRGRVGWVERSETRHGRSRAARPLMGFAALNPSYELSGRNVPDHVSQTAAIHLW